MGLEPTNLLTASQALYQLSYAPVATNSQATGGSSPGTSAHGAPVSAKCQRLSRSTGEHRGGRSRSASIRGSYRDPESGRDLRKAADILRRETSAAASGSGSRIR
jgi:hypothetical protein